MHNASYYTFGMVYGHLHFLIFVIFLEFENVAVERRHRDADLARRKAQVERARVEQRRRERQHERKQQPQHSQEKK